MIALGRCNGAPLCGVQRYPIGTVTAAPIREGAAKGAASRPKIRAAEIAGKRRRYPSQPRDSASLSIIYCEGTILDSYKPSQYGPRGFGGGNIVILPEPSRVSKAWPTTHAKKVIANNSRPTRLRSPRGLSVSAAGSAGARLPLHPTP